MSILGLAVFITGIAIIVFGITTAARYGSTPPPNAGSIGQGQVLGGAGLAAFGVVLLGSALALLADLRRSRPIAAIVAVVAAILSAIAVVRVTTLGIGDPILAGSLAVATVIFAAAAVILARRPK